MGSNLHVIEDHPLRGGWWLLDAETNGFDPMTDDIIMVRLAYMENYEIGQELSFCVRPKYLASPGIVRLTKYTAKDTEQAIPIRIAVRRVGLLVLDAPLLIYHFDFLFPFFRVAFHHHAEKEFDFPCLSLEWLAMHILGLEKKERLDALAMRFPAPKNKAPQNVELSLLYRAAASTLMQAEADGMGQVKELLSIFGDVP